jgi:hypothetical protein
VRWGRMKVDPSPIALFLLVAVVRWLVVVVLIG